MELGSATGQVGPKVVQPSGWVLGVEGVLAIKEELLVVKFPRTLTSRTGLIVDDMLVCVVHARRPLCRGLASGCSSGKGCSELCSKAHRLSTTCEARIEVARD